MTCSEPISDLLLIQRQLFARRIHAIQISGIFWINIYDLWRHSAGSFPMAHWLFINHGSTCSQQSHWSRKTQRWTYVHLHVQALPCRCSIWDSSLDDSTYMSHVHEYHLTTAWQRLDNQPSEHTNCTCAPARLLAHVSRQSLDVASSHLLLESTSFISRQPRRTERNIG